MNSKRKATGLCTLAVLFAGLLMAAEQPETVHVTYHVQAGKLEEFLGVLKEHHPTCLKLGLVLPEPHIILSSKEEDGKPLVIEILTWKDSDAPDSVPERHPEVKKIWDRLNALVEKRGGKRAIEIEQMDIVSGTEKTTKSGRQ
jgi:hypothetical protein